MDQMFQVQNYFQHIDSDETGTWGIGEGSSRHLTGLESWGCADTATAHTVVEQEKNLCFNNPVSITQTQTQSQKELIKWVNPVKTREMFNTGSALRALLARKSRSVGGDPCALRTVRAVRRVFE